jgi:hypothetical protein
MNIDLFLKPKSKEEIENLLLTEQEDSFNKEIKRIVAYLLSIIDSDFIFDDIEFLCVIKNNNNNLFKIKRTLTNSDNMIMPLDFCKEIQLYYKKTGLVKYKELKEIIRKHLIQNVTTNLTEPQSKNGLFD